MESKQIYLRFLNLIHALDGGANAPAMDLDAKKLLEVIAVRHAQEKPLTVTDAMALGEIASPATMHRKIEALKSQGYVSTEFQGANRRAQYLVPSKQGLNYLDALGQALLQAAK